ncbi:MAG TPA: MOFRL family protein, partial [Anaerolineaceae bacterium]|nr:MOFRL family protein [Anaerolineaceae bacterium]
RKFFDYINQGRLKRPVMWVGGGETTVTICGNGKGGRNQELALAAVEPMAGLADVALITLATDGEDGPTDAAGAIVTGDTYARGKQNSMIPSDYLAINNSYEYFDQLNSLIRLGPTGTNVNDLCFLFAYD